MKVLISVVITQYFKVCYFLPSGWYKFLLSLFVISFTCCVSDVLVAFIVEGYPPPANYFFLLVSVERLRQCFASDLNIE